MNNHDALVPVTTEIPDNNREGPTLDKAGHLFGLIGRPHLTETIVPVKRFLDLDFQAILDQCRGVILDVDGTLVEHHSNEFPPEVIALIEAIMGRVKVCIFSNNNQPRPPLVDLGLPFVTNVKPKPHPHGFEEAARLLGLTPEECAMIGDNLITDGGARRAKMKLALVEPIPGPENPFHKLLRGYGHWVKSVHDRIYRPAR